MKKILLSLAVALCSAAAMASSYTKPTVPTGGGFTYVTSTTTTDDDGTSVTTITGDSTVYYILNVEKQQFLSAGATWGTRAVIDSTGSKALGYIITKYEDGQYTLWSADAGNYGYLYHGGDPISVWTDSWYDINSDYNLFSITASDDAYIIGQELNSVYGTSGSLYSSSSEYIDASVYSAYLLGWDPSGVDYNSSGADMGTNQSVYMISSSNTATKWQFVAESDYLSYGAKMALYNALVESESYDGLIDADVLSTAKTQFESGTDVEAMNAAAEALESANFAAKVYEVLAGASEDSPKDATSLLTNPDFSTGDITGWTCSFVSGTTAANVGYQGATYTNESVDTYTNHNGDVVYPNLTNFIEAWTWTTYGTAPYSIGDAELCQTLEGLPAGTYVLACDASACQQYGSNAGTTVTGVQLFATGGDIDVYTSIATGEGQPEHYTLKFDSDGGDITMGLRTRSTTANWIAADNSELTYYGDTGDSPYLVSLQVSAEQYEVVYTDLDNLRANSDIIKAYEEALEAANAASSELSDDELVSLRADLIAAAEALEESVSDYETAATNLTTIDDYCSSAKANGWVSLQEDLDALYSEYKEAYNDNELTSEEISNMIAEAQALISAYISENCNEGDDISILISNNKFDTKDLSAWTITGGTPTIGGVDTYYTNTVEDVISVEDIGSYNAEVYWTAFDMSQTLYQLPAGLYTFGCQALVRDDGGDGITSYLYAVVGGEEQKQQVMSIYDETNETALYIASGYAIGTWPSDVAYGDGYIPNSMNGANTWFYYGHYKQSFSFLVTEQSDVTIGLRQEDGNEWMLWDNFSLTYMGNSVSV